MDNFTLGCFCSRNHVIIILSKLFYSNEILMVCRLWLVRLKNIFTLELFNFSANLQVKSTGCPRKYHPVTYRKSQERVPFLGFVLVLYSLECLKLNEDTKGLSKSSSSSWWSSWASAKLCTSTAAFYYLLVSGAGGVFLTAYWGFSFFDLVLLVITDVVYDFLPAAGAGGTFCLEVTCTSTICWAWWWCYIY